MKKIVKGSYKALLKYCVFLSKTIEIKIILMKTIKTYKRPKVITNRQC